MSIIIVFHILKFSVNFIFLCDVLICNFVQYGFDLYGSAGTCNKNAKYNGGFQHIASSIDLHKFTFFKISPYNIYMYIFHDKYS